MFTYLAAGQSFSEIDSRHRRPGRRQQNRTIHTQPFDVQQSFRHITVSAAKKTDFPSAILPKCWLTRARTCREISPRSCKSFAPERCSGLWPPLSRSCGSRSWRFCRRSPRVAPAVSKLVLKLPVAPCTRADRIVLLCAVSVPLGTCCRSISGLFSSPLRICGVWRPGLIALAKLLETNARIEELWNLCAQTIF